MMSIRFILFGFCFALLAACQQEGHDVREVGIIPQPRSQQLQEGTFSFSSSVVWQVENDDQKKIVNQFNNTLSGIANFKVKIDQQPGDIRFITDPSLQEEEYKLIVTPNKIEIKASSITGFFYAAQGMRQLLPTQSSLEDQLSIPCLTIHDAPRFAYRGLMLDVSRYFIPKENVLKIVDAAAMLKINKLHFHLVDDNGWRLEIKKYPKLTQVGAWRVKRDEFFSGRENQLPGETTTEGGFYSQDDIREIVRYAQDRHVEVIPEIEMPAHTNSSLAAYPHLACPVVKEPITVIPGIGGDNAEIIYCAGNDDVFTFLEDVIDEVAELFPSNYIHLGGDEATKTYWKQCPKCQARMVKESIHSEEELQSYFMKRMSTYVQAKGKIPMGWDELTNSTLPEDVVIFGWRGDGYAALKAAKLGHPVVMTPARKLYLIRYQGPQWFEPRTYFGNNTLKDVYDYEPISDKWDEQTIPMLKGVQASLWTEFCTSPTDVEYLVFPRLAALAEVAWSQKEQKSWSDFLLRLDPLLNHWDMQGITYAQSMYNLDHRIKPHFDSLQVSISCIRPDVEVRYTLDGSEPKADSPKWTNAQKFVKGTLLRAASFQEDQRKGEVLNLNLVWNKATAKEVHVVPANGAKYTLTNGLRGSDKHSDFEWCGWYAQDASVLIDLEKKEQLSHIAMGVVNNYGMGVHMPSRIIIEASDNGQDFTKVYDKKYTASQVFRRGIFKEEQVFNQEQFSARYLRVRFEKPGKCPSDHIKAGKETWFYIDELIVE